MMTVLSNKTSKAPSEYECMNVSQGYINQVQGDLKFYRLEQLCESDSVLPR